MSISEQNLYLRDYWRVISRRRRVVLLFFAITFGLVLVGTFAVTPQYEGKTKVLIEKGEVGELSGRGRGSAYDPEFYQTQFQLIKSQAVARRVIDILQLPKDYVEKTSGQPFSQGIAAGFAQVLHAVKSIFGSGADENAAVSEESWKDRAAAAISAKIKVAPVAESHLVAISYTSPDPAFAAQVANTTAQAFIEETLDLKMDATRRNLQWMNEKAQVERAQLEKAEQALHAYMQANGIVTLENRLAVTPEQLSEVSTQLVRAEARRKELEVLKDQVEQVTRDPAAAETVTAIAVDSTLQTLRTQIVQTEKQIMELSNKYGPKHPAMVKANGDLRMLQDKRSQEIRRIVRAIRNDYALALSNENSLRAQLNFSKSETLQLNERFIRYGALKREVESIRQTYDALMLKLREQGITGENRPVNLWIVEAAGVPLSPSTPRKGLNLLLGLLLGLTGGVGLAFFLDFMDNRITDPDKTEAILAASVLSVIPLCQENGKHIEGIVLKHPLSAFAENYKTLRSILMLALAEATPSKILITSAFSGEGKTTTAVNLAIALAQAEKRVVLIDGDLRKGRLHKLFHTSNAVGLSNYLAGTGEEILQPGPIPNLSIVTAGPIPPNPAELISSHRLQHLLDALSEDFDYIICDSPPVLMVADAPVLGRNFDGTILVSKAHRTTHEMAIRAIRILRDRRLRVLGVVINGMDPKHDEYYYGEYHAASGPSQLIASRAMIAGPAPTQGE